MRTLPRTSNDRRKAPSTPGCKDPDSREAKIPALFVKLSENTYYGAKYAKARVRIRKGCYWYLVWRDGEATREFYLGKRENSPPRDGDRPPAPATSTRSGARARVRGTKRGTV